jgi:hypothetical protein
LIPIFIWGELLNKLVIEVTTLIPKKYWTPFIRAKTQKIIITIIPAVLISVPDPVPDVC